jgi:apolipoprotein D and lipocalin family protein
MLRRMKKIFIALSLLTVLAGCTTFRKPEPLPSVDQVDLNRFLGTWHVIASVPGTFDKEAHNAVEIYTRTDKGIQIDYQFNAGGFDGKLKNYSRRVTVNDPGINSNWDVTYLWPYKKDFRVIHLAQDYSLAVVGDVHRKNVYIMARQKQIEDTVYSDIVLMLQGLGYNVGKMRLVPHS